MRYHYGWDGNNDLFNQTMVGQTFDRVEGKEGGEELTFWRNGTKLYALGHVNDCCEAVWLADINGDLEDLVGSPIIRFDERVENPTHDENDDYIPESSTWTFYHITTAKGTVILRWVGESNGYYSESVDFFDYTEEDERGY